MSLLDRIESTYTTLPSLFFSQLEPKENQASLELLNPDVANILGISIEELRSVEGIKWLSGGQKIDKTPFAQAYAGHQYGHFSMLGDGRAAIIGEIVQEQRRYDLHLKGSGRTPYSRRGDGNATLYSMLREYLMSEAMHHLGVPTTRSLSIVQTGDTVYREKPEKGAILCRVGASHIRFGTFEYARSYGTLSELKQLADYAINRHYPQLNNDSNKYLLFFREVVQKQAKLVALWQSIGFVHGVLNTDNMLISGETIDYGPCAFLDQYQPQISFSSIDRQGRYSYQRQPFIISWNLSKFAEALMPLIADTPQLAVPLLNSELQQFEHIFKSQYYTLMRRKLGLLTEQDGDQELIDQLLKIVEQEKADYTLFFYHLTSGTIKQNSIFHTEAFYLWYNTWKKRINTLQQTDDAYRLMREHNPVVIPRNQLVEKALKEYAYEDNPTLFHQLLDAYQDPYNYNKIIDLTLLEPLHPGQSFTTYCGT